MKILYALSCDHAEPKEDGRLDIHGVFHELFAPGFPAKHQMVFLLGVEWDVEAPGRRDFKIDLLDPSGSPALTIQGHTEVQEQMPSSPPPRTVLVMPIEDVRFPMAGTYEFRLTIEGESYPLAPLHLIEDPNIEIQE